MRPMQTRAAGPWADVFGGLSAMLVAVPSAVAFGLMVHAPLGGDLVAQGALVGMVGAVVLGLVAPLVGGTARLITAPCAPAAAVLAGLTTQLVSAREGGAALPPEKVLALLGVLGLIAGLMQLALGFAGGGRIIKYIPYPVVAGYLAGVGLTIFAGQLPRVLGAPSGTGFFAAFVGVDRWVPTSLLVGTASMLVMVGVARLMPRVPAPLVALVAGAGLDLLVRWVSGAPAPAASTGGGELWGPAVDRWSHASTLTGADLGLLFVPALTLAALLSLDTLKTCVVLDALTNSRHNSDKELRGQGAANLLSAALGGMPGAGTMGATLVNLHGGGQTRRSSLVEGALSLLALLALRPVIGALPSAALAGIMVVVGVRMVDRDIFNLVRQRTTRLDFAVVMAVAATAVGVGLVSAAGVGLALCILLFVREQMSGSVVRHRGVGAEARSKRRRLRADMAVLEKHGAERVVIELQGNLFFGTTDQLLSELGPLMGQCRWLVLDFRRVQSIDFSGAHLLEQLEHRLGDKDGVLVLAEMPTTLPTGTDVRRYLGDVGLGRGHSHVRIMSTLDSALEWTEDQLLEAHGVVTHGREQALAAHEIEMLQGFPPEVLSKLVRVMQERTVAAGEFVFHRGDSGDSLFFIRRGAVRIELGLENGRRIHLATFGQGDFFGDMAFIDADVRSADATAATETELYVLSRGHMEEAAAADPRVGQALFDSLSRTLAHRLRITDRELMALQGA
ncbi:MAG: SLC26A/SulP transporter family protein [Deltaproteobacteria bacterium]|nr:SLC26A/SulP transporter family protein [Deltaproteobacteria bacterium]